MDILHSSNFCRKSYVYFLLLLLSCFFSKQAFATPSNTKLTVWVSEAVVTTYTFDFENFVKQQKAIAKYFTTEGWVNYTKAFEESKILEAVQKNSYYVSAVPTMPPVIKEVKENQWEAVIPVLVVYKNPAYKQKQNLKVTVKFASSGKQGVRGFAISSLKAIVTEPPCRCTNSKSKAVAAIV